MGKARLDRNDLQLPGGKRMQVEGVGRGGYNGNSVSGIVLDAHTLIFHKKYVIGSILACNDVQKAD